MIIMYKVIMQIQDDETKETDVKEKIFSSIEEAQKYICEYDEFMNTIKFSNIFKNNFYIGVITQNCRFWTKDSKYGKAYAV